MTDEERAEEAQRLARQRAGEFFLKDASVSERAAITWFRQKAYTTAVDEEGPRYQAILADLGVDATTREQIVDHIGKIADAATKAVLAETQQLEARRALEKRLEQISPEAVTRLKEGEAFRRATLEYEGHNQAQMGLGGYLEERLGNPVKPEYRETILSLIQGAGAITTEYSNGPFDDVLLPAVGGPMVAERLEDLAGRIAAGAETLKEAMRQSELPPQYQEVIKDYYANKIQEKRATAAHVLLREQQPETVKMPPELLQ